MSIRRGEIWLISVDKNPILDNVKIAAVYPKAVSVLGYSNVYNDHVVQRYYDLKRIKFVQRIKS